MASFTKLVFFAACISSLFTNGTAAPLLMRRDAAASTTPLTLKAQQDNYAFDLSTSLNPVASTIVTLETVPANCALYNSLGNECPTYFVASNVTFDDCSDAFTICQCSNANMSLSTAVDRLGRVPVGLRRYVATVALLEGNATRAYTLTSGDIHIFGDPQVDTWVHEVSRPMVYLVLHRNQTQNPYRPDMRMTLPLVLPSLAPQSGSTPLIVIPVSQTPIQPPAPAKSVTSK